MVDENTLCGQYTFYFPQCNHATSHLYHRNTAAGQLCSHGCRYSIAHDYYYKSPFPLCSYCLSRPQPGIGTWQDVSSSIDPAVTPSCSLNQDEHQWLLRKISEESQISGNQEYQQRLQEILNQYLVATREHKQRLGLQTQTTDIPTTGREARRQRHADRQILRSMRAQRKLDRWVLDVRSQQYNSLLQKESIGERPYIHSIQPHTPAAGLLVELKPSENIKFRGGCAVCQESLYEKLANGTPHKLPCGHVFHYECAQHMFRWSDGERSVYTCISCKTWYSDVRILPDIMEICRAREHDFNSEEDSSEVSEPETVQWKSTKQYDQRPPWIHGSVRRGSQSVPSIQESKRPAQSSRNNPLEYKKSATHHVSNAGPGSSRMSLSNPFSPTGLGNLARAMDRTTMESPTSPATKADSARKPSVDPVSQRNAAILRAGSAALQRAEAAARIKKRRASRMSLGARRFGSL